MCKVFKSSSINNVWDQSVHSKYSEMIVFIAVGCFTSQQSGFLFFIFIIIILFYFFFLVFPVV
jgi:hypothetical protein